MLLLVKNRRNRHFQTIYFKSSQIIKISGDRDGDTGRVKEYSNNKPINFLVT